MELKQFIRVLKNISENVDNSETIEVRMADCIPVVKPIFKNNTVFITDIDLEADMTKLPTDAL